MTAPANRTRGTKRHTIVVVVWLAILGVGAVATHDFLSLESAQARALVTEGQSYQAKGDRSKATLAFERARLLAPRSSIVGSTPAGPSSTNVGSSVDSALMWITPREWTRLGVVFGWVAGLGAAIAIAGRRDSLATRRVAIVAGIAFVLSAGGALESNRASRALAVVTGPTGVLVSPYDGAGATGDLHPGAVVVVGSRYGHFLHVSGPDGAEGWVVSGALEPVVGTSI
jgi:hypothetical protein